MLNIVGETGFYLFSPKSTLYFNNSLSMRLIDNYLETSSFYFYLFYTRIKFRSCKCKISCIKVLSVMVPLKTLQGLICETDNLHSKNNHALCIH